ncbi:MAG: DUF1501 domain-containing protein [Pirellulaceae bacterium]
MFHATTPHASVSRRDFVRIGGLSALGLSLPAWLQLRSAQGEEAAKGKAKSCIVIWLDGGPSHLETFDLKPDAPAEVRGPFASIPTSAGDVRICEHLPKLAERMEHAAIIRSMTSPLGEHNLGTHYLLTGYAPSPAIEYPAIGSVVGHLRGDGGVLPPHIAVPDFRVGGRNLGGNGYLPASAKPFSLNSDPARGDFQVPDLDFYPGTAADRIDRRRDYLAALDRLSREADAKATPPKQFEQAYRLLTSPGAKRAFNLNEEKPQTRAAYGPRSIGQSCLLARRLVEQGVPFVTVTNPGWDTHQNLDTQLRAGYTGAKVGVGLIPSLDLAISALLDDLNDRGLLESTLIVVMGEFGRTPKLNTSAGRDHWPRVFSVLLAGGGVKGGQVIGSSDKTGESPHEHAVTPADLAATMFTLLGLDPQLTLQTADGRPIHLSRDGKVIQDLI